MWVMAVACVRHQVHQLLHPMPHCLVLLIEISAAPRASVTAAPGVSVVMHPMQHIYISQRFLRINPKPKTKKHANSQLWGEESISQISGLEQRSGSELTGLQEHCR